MRSKKYLKAALLALLVSGASVPMMAHNSMPKHGSAEECHKAYVECQKGCASNDKNSTHHKKIAHDKNSTHDCMEDCAKGYAECRGITL